MLAFEGFRLMRMPFWSIEGKRSLLNENHVLETSDMHGYVYPTNFADDTEQGFGVAKVATKMKELRQAATGPVVTIENGDFIQGSPLLLHRQKPALRCRIDRCRQPPGR